MVLTDYLKEQGDLSVVVLTDLFSLTTDKLSDINALCRSKGISFINTSQNGLFGRIFNDFGEDFVVLDKDGEELQEVMIKDISVQDGQTVVTLLEGFKHRFSDGDQVTFKEVSGMLGQTEGDSVNGKTATVKTITPQKFAVDLEISGFTAYEGNGIAK